MNERLPPLTALRAFDAAARHMSFAKAAEELNVTPAALSYQIKSLEQDLGLPLFKRLNRAVELTSAGRALAPGAAEAFGTLSAAWRATRRLLDEQKLTVTAGPAFTAKWMAPRLYSFAQAHPGIDLAFVASLRLADFNRDDVDVAIRFGIEASKDLFVEPLTREWMTPMMTPELARSVRTPADLAQATLIHDDSILPFTPVCDWALWARAEGLELDTSHGPRFSQADHALDAAEAGVGVVLGRVSLAAQALMRGRLVAPFSTGIIAPAQFRFLCPKGAETRPQVAAFRAWLKEELDGSDALAEGHDLIDASEVSA